jgi:hypothetical protein
MSSTAVCACTFLALATTATAGPLIGGEPGAGAMHDVDKRTAATVQIAQLNPFGGISGLAYDAAGDILYAVDAGPELIYAVDHRTGEATTIASVDGVNATGLAFDSTTGMLYVSTVDDNKLIIIDPATGDNATIGAFVNASGVEGLAYDTRTGTLYALSDLTDQLVTIDVDTAIATPVLDLPPVNWRGLAYDAELDALFASVSISGHLYRIDLAGDPSLDDIGMIAPAFAIQGLAIVADACLADVNGDGELNILDFVAFQGEFVAGNDTADCDDDGMLNILDFVCFQQLFQAGCP